MMTDTESSLVKKSGRVIEYELTSINPNRAARIGAITTAIYAIFAGSIQIVVSLMSHTSEGVAATLFIYPILVGISYVSALVGAIIYNKIAYHYSGFTVEILKREQ